MSRAGLSLATHVIGQLNSLCHMLGVTHSHTALSMLEGILGPAGHRSLSEPPLWPSDVSDDHTPVEFSIALDHGRTPTLRLLAETTAATPSSPANRLAALDLLNTWSVEHRIPLDRLRLVQDLFLPATSQGRFWLWFSLVLRADKAPTVKVYLDPTSRGLDRGGDLVAEGLSRFGFGAAWPIVRRHASRDGQLVGDDWPTFFAVDLLPGRGSRVKVYIAHESATAGDAARAAGAAGIDGTEIDAFCDVAGAGPGPYNSRPLISAYTFLPGDVDRPSGYSLYLPIRSYMDNDQEAWHRVRALAARYRYDPAPLEAAIAALIDRRLTDGVGLIAHVSLRLGHGEPGITVYLSSEAYQVTPPRHHTTTATTAHGGSST